MAADDDDEADDDEDAAAVRRIAAVAVPRPAASACMVVVGIGSRGARGWVRGVQAGRGLRGGAAIACRGRDEEERVSSARRVWFFFFTRACARAGARSEGDLGCACVRARVAGRQSVRVCRAARSERERGKRRRARAPLSPVDADTADEAPSLRPSSSSRRARAYTHDDQRSKSRYKKRSLETNQTQITTASRSPPRASRRRCWEAAPRARRPRSRRPTPPRQPAPPARPRRSA